MGLFQRVFVLSNHLKREEYCRAATAALRDAHADGLSSPQAVVLAVRILRERFPGLDQQAAFDIVWHSLPTR